MPMRDFDYLQPTSLAEALELKAGLGPRARFIAGGTDVMVLARAGRLEFDALISLRRAPELKGVRAQGESLVIGGGATLSELLADQTVRRRLPALHEAVQVMGCTQMRNLATLGGNLMSAVASGDTIPPLLAAGAVCRLAGARGERRVDLAEFFTGPRATAAEPDELLAAVEVPLPPEGSGAAFAKLGRRAALDLAVVSLAVHLEPGGDGAIAGARAAAGAVGPTPLRLPSAEKILAGGRPGARLFARAGEAALADCSPWDDVRASKWYREEMIRTLLPRVCARAWERAGGRS
jgi:CO/xanthine dehydrogenase FAD-binding subunit